LSQAGIVGLAGDRADRIEALGHGRRCRKRERQGGEGEPHLLPSSPISVRHPHLILVSTDAPRSISRDLQITPPPPRSSVWLM
jgi:hypothetical protein